MCQNLPSKSIFYIKNHPNLSHFFSLKNTNLGAHICYWYFLILSDFVPPTWRLHNHNPWSSTYLTHNGVKSVLKRLSNFVSTVWKLHNPYYHIRDSHHINLTFKWLAFRHVFFLHHDLSGFVSYLVKKNREKKMLIVCLFFFPLE